MSDKYLIWNFERGQWWKPGEMGYTPSMRLAGRYSFMEADTICRQANSWIGLTAPPEEAMVPVMDHWPEEP
jgi:hypothetical protein